MSAWEATLTGICVVVLLTMVVVPFLPYHSGHRPPPKVALCRSNLKQVAIGLIMYAADHEERLPPVSGCWLDASLPYTKSDDVYHCPALRGSRDYGYALSDSLHTLQLPKPETVPLVFDSNVLTRGARESLKTIALPVRHESSLITFADGHVEPSSTGLAREIARTGKVP